MSFLESGPNTVELSWIILNYSSTHYIERKLRVFSKELPSKRITRQLHLTDVNEVNLLRRKDKVRAHSRPLWQNLNFGIHKEK